MTSDAVHFYTNATDRSTDDVPMGGNESNEDPALASDKVHSLANSIYQEFEAMIQRHGEGVIDGLMPLIVGMLESMDQLYTDKGQLAVDLEMVREDQTQLMAQFERERQLRKSAEERILTVEDNSDEEKRYLQEKIEGMESLVRLMEMKNRNTQEHVNRLEEKEFELKRDHSQLHERYTELLRNHMDQLERSKLLLSNAGPNGCCACASNKVEGSHSPRVRSAALAPRRQLEFKSNSGQCNSQTQEADENPVHKSESYGNQDNLRLELDSTEASRRPTETKPHKSIDEFEMDQPLCAVYNEDEAGDFEDLIQPTAEEEENASNDEFGEMWMSREIEGLIKENVELNETKNALNVVKDDLIVKVDDLSGENAMLQEEVNSLRQMKMGFKERVAFLEHENRDFRNQVDNLKRRLNEYEDDFEEANHRGEGLSTSKNRFTRKEFERVLHERNDYKERFLELQEAIRLVDSVRAKRRVREEEGQSDSAASGGGGGIAKYLLTTVQGVAASMAAAVSIEDEMQQDEEGIALGLDMQQATAVGGLSVDTGDSPGTVGQSNDELPSKVQDTELASEQQMVQPVKRGGFWNFFGNLLGQTVVQTAETLVGTGSDFPMAVSRESASRLQNSCLSPTVSLLPQNPACSNGQRRSPGAAQRQHVVASSRAGGSNGTPAPLLLSTGAGAEGGQPLVLVPPQEAVTLVPPD